MTCLRAERKQGCRTEQNAAARTLPMQEDDQQSSHSEKLLTRGGGRRSQSQEKNKKHVTFAKEVETHTE